MSYRRGAPSHDPDAVERRDWYVNLQSELYYKSSESEDSADDSIYNADKKNRITFDKSVKSDTASTKQSRAGTTSGKGHDAKSVSSETESRAESPVFVSFASALAVESTERMEKATTSVASNESFLSASRIIKDYDLLLLDNMLLRLNNPAEIRYA